MSENVIPAIATTWLWYVIKMFYFIVAQGRHMTP